MPTLEKNRYTITNVFFMALWLIAIVAVVSYSYDGILGFVDSFYDNVREAENQLVQYSFAQY